MIPLLFTISYLLFFLLTGFLLLRLIFKHREKPSLEATIGISFGLGAGIFAFCHLLTMDISGKLYSWPYLFATMAIFLANFMIKESPLVFFQTSHDSEQKTVHGKRLIAAFAILFVLFQSILFANALRLPLTSYDGRGIWNYKSKIMLEENTVFSDSFNDPMRVHYHRDYPLMMSTVNFGLYKLLGNVDERRVRVIFSTFLLVSFLAMVGLFRKTGEPIGAIFLALAYAAIIFRKDWAERDGGAINSAAVDFPLSFFALMTVAGYYFWWKRKEFGWLIIAAIFCGFALMTKKEGMVVLAVTCGGNVLQWLVEPNADKKKNFLHLAAGMGISILVAAPWLIASRYLPNLYDEDYGSMMTKANALMVPARLPMILWHFWGEFIEIPKWNITWILYVIIVPLSLKRWFQYREFYLDAMIVAWLLGYLFVYSFSPLNLVFHLNTSSTRLLSHLLPIIFFRFAVFYGNRIESVLQNSAAPGTEATA